MALPVNPMHAGMPMRALLTAMQAWITTGVEPPASRVPMRAHGTLVEAADAVPRNIPGLPYTGIHTRRELYRSRRCCRQNARQLSGVRAARRQRWHGHRRHSHAAARGAARDLHRMESARRRFWRRPPCFRCRARWCRLPPPARARGVRRSAAFTGRALRRRRSLCRRGAGGRSAKWSPSGCCCRRTPSAPSSWRRRTGCLNCTEASAGRRLSKCAAAAFGSRPLPGRR